MCTTLLFLLLYTLQHAHLPEVSFHPIRLISFTHFTPPPIPEYKFLDKSKKFVSLVLIG